jgi:hypothetical protein
MIDVHFIIAAFHILFVAPLFGYIFIQRAATPEWLYTLLFFLGLFVFVYHSYKAVFKFISKSSSLWVNLIHVLIIAPLIVYIGYKSKKTPRAAYEMLGLVTFAALCYHMFNIIRTLQTHDDSADK